ncbi:hypothetical protein [Halosimplex carlsbadense]|nr:hypothetical protein [Halosimplex carlsbadense]
MEYDRSDQVRSIVEDHAETTVGEVADIMLMSEGEIRDYVEDLKNRGEVAERDGKLRPT